MDALLAAIQTEVPDLEGATFYREEPVRHPPNGQHLAVWFEGNTPDDRYNTTGDIAVVDLYGIRYWQRADDRTRKTVDEDRAADIETIMDAVVAVIMAHQSGIGSSYDTRYGGGRKFIGEDGDSGAKGNMVAGFEIAVKCRRAVAFT